MKFEEMGLSRQLLDALAAMGFTTPTPIQEEAIPILLKGEDLIGQAKTGTGKTAAFGLPIIEAWLKEKHPAHNSSHPQNAAYQPHNVNQPTQTHQPVHSHQIAHQPAQAHQIAHQKVQPHAAHQQHANHLHPQPYVHGSDGNRSGYAPGIAIPSALILVPTRELAVQVHATLQKMAGKTGAHIVPVYGGVEIRKQYRMFQSQVDVVVGTPGRTLDHMRQGSLKLGQIRTVVLDEADRMLDMGFIRDVVKILDAMPAHRQTLLFSATMPKEIAHMAHKYMRNPKTIKVSEDSLTVKDVRQFYVRCTNAQRLGMLLAAIRTEKPYLSLIFCRMKHEAKKIARQLKLNGIKADAMHGNLSQKARDRTMERFKSGDIEVMVATDLASRGIDVPGITHVFNYELPDDPMTYVHRIGRTARAGAKGTAISLITGDPRHATWSIERATGAKMSEMALKPDNAIMPEPQQERQGGHGRPIPHERREWPGNRGWERSGRRHNPQGRRDGTGYESHGKPDRRSHSPNHRQDRGNLAG